METNEEDAAPFVPRGSIYRSDGDRFGAEGSFIINLDDRLNMTNHSEKRRLTGCCGVAGLDGANQVCVCGAEVATEKSDCWMPHALVFERAAVELVEIPQDGAG